MKHDLHDFIEQLSQKMVAEYHRIRKAASQDPGTAGDEGEENWAELLRDWLPPYYRVVTRGQLIDTDGSLSPQVDVIVLKPNYPRALHHKKKYLVAGVAAAFECKTTLKRDHIVRAVQTAAKIKRMTHPRQGTPYRELVGQPIFGVFAHSAIWTDSRGIQAIIESVDKILHDADLCYVKHPREMLDILCISDLATWVTSKQPLSHPDDDPTGLPTMSYMCHFGEETTVTIQRDVKPIGVFIAALLAKMAWEDATLRDIASYFVAMDFSRSSSGKFRRWPRSIYSPQLRRKLKFSSLVNEIGWGEWDVSID